MRIAILGGGVTGLTAAYYLAKKNHQVTIFEKEKQLGGLASGFKMDKWDWYLDRAYHHLFSNDNYILDFAKEIGFNDIFFKSPVTASLYKIKNNRFWTSQNDVILGTTKGRTPESKYRIYPLDTPQDLLKFPLLNFFQKIRAGIVIVFLKLSPYLKFYEKITSIELLKKSMGDGVWNILWQELFRKKYGKYAGNIVASWIWARINKRTKNLGYIKGGFQHFIDYLAHIDKKLDVNILVGQAIDKIEKRGKQFKINNENFDVTISTLPTPVIVKLADNIFPKKYLVRLKNIQYLHAINLIIESKEKILTNAYWLNICDEKLPMMVMVQHTNFIDKKYYDNNHLLYVAKYIDSDDLLLKMSDEEIYKYFTSYFKQINPNYSLLTANYKVFKAPFSQPIFNKEFIKNKPDFITPIKNFYITNLDMTFPYDRGTNYAVNIGKKIADMI